MSNMADDKKLRFPFRFAKRSFSDLSNYSFTPADKRYILHICHQRFGNLNQEKARESTITLLRRYKITLQRINYWLDSALTKNIDAVGDVPALPPLYSPGNDGKFNCKIEEHPDFDMDIVVQYYIDYKDVLHLSHETIQEWYGINRSRFGTLVIKANQKANQKAKRKTGSKSAQPFKKKAKPKAGSKSAQVKAIPKAVPQSCIQYSTMQQSFPGAAEDDGNICVI